MKELNFDTLSFATEVDFVDDDEEKIKEKGFFEETINYESKIPSDTIETIWNRKDKN